MDRTLTLFCLTSPNDAEIEFVDDPVKHLRQAAALQLSALDEGSAIAPLNTSKGVACIRLKFPEDALVREVEDKEKQLAVLRFQQQRVENELQVQQEEAADKEKELTQALNDSRAETSSTKKELDDVRLSQSKLKEKYDTAVKHYDFELGTARRNIGVAEAERATMQRKIDDLIGQNQELSKAFTTLRGRTLEREPGPGTSGDDNEVVAENTTPEHSPPPSPTKATPRHSALETETMKSSLHHAHRTIQSQKSLLHREKTEKLELRRIIQDLRDDLEKVRSDPKRSSSRRAVIHDDPDWEDSPPLSPRTSATVGPTVIGQAGGESAFETANERATDTEDFQTINEEFSSSDDPETETEGTSRSFGKLKEPPSLPSGLSLYASRNSVNNTTYTSTDEDDDADTRTPTGTMSSQRSNRFRLSRNIFNRSGQASEEPTLQSSPANSVGSGRGTPQAGKSLFAELQDLDGTDGE